MLCYNHDGVTMGKMEEDEALCVLGMPKLLFL